MTPTGENLARFDTNGAGRVQWDHPKPSIIERVVLFLRRK